MRGILEELSSQRSGSKILRSTPRCLRLTPYTRTAYTRTAGPLIPPHSHFLSFSLSSSQALKLSTTNNLSAKSLCGHNRDSSVSPCSSPPKDPPPSFSQHIAPPKSTRRHCITAQHSTGRNKKVQQPVLVQIDIDVQVQPLHATNHSDPQPCLIRQKLGHPLPPPLPPSLLPPRLVRASYRQHPFSTKVVTSRPMCSRRHISVQRSVVRRLVIIQTPAAQQWIRRC